MVLNKIICIKAHNSFSGKTVILLVSVVATLGNIYNYQLRKVTWIQIPLNWHKKSEEQRPLLTVNRELEQGPENLPVTCACRKGNWTRGNRTSGLQWILLKRGNRFQASVRYAIAHTFEQVEDFSTSLLFLSCATWLETCPFQLRPPHGLTLMTTKGDSGFWEQTSADT